MRKLALLSIAFPLTAFATSAIADPAALLPPGSHMVPLSETNLGWVSKAKAHCSAGNGAPATGKCVNDYLQAHYGVIVFRDPSGTIRLATTGGADWGQDATAAFAVQNINTPSPQTPGR